MVRNYIYRQPNVSREGASLYVQITAEGLKTFICKNINPRISIAMIPVTNMATDTITLLIVSITKCLNMIGS